MVTPSNTSKKSSKESLKMQTKALHFWDSVQTKGQNKVLQEGKYRAALTELRSKVGINVVNDYIFNVKNVKIDDFLEQKAEIDKEYKSKIPSTSSIDAKGNYIYSDLELEEIEFIKKM